MTEQPLLDVRDLSVTFQTAGGPLRAVDKASLQVSAGETLALVGESGSGKSTVAMAAAGLLDGEARVTGVAQIAGRNMTSLREAARRKLRGHEISIVFQDPFTSLNPGLTIGRQVAEPLQYHEKVGREEAERRTLEALAEVGLPEPESLLSAYPHQLSGGMQQRVLIAGALICNPKLLILDEPTTALDVTVEARILDLLDEIRHRRGLGMLFITHNLGVVNRIADRVCVLYAGRIVELGGKRDVMAAPAHPYTKGLLASLPKLVANKARERLAPIPGRMPDMTDPPGGCVFMDRCRFAEDACARPQDLAPVGDKRRARCWKAEDLLGVAWPAHEPELRPAAAVSGDVAAPSKGELIVEDLGKTFIGGRMRGTRWTFRFGIPVPYQMRRLTRAVDGVSFKVQPGEVVGLVGESGSGKSTLGRLLLRLIEADEGRITFEGTDIRNPPENKLKNFRQRAQVVFQNPDSSLNPRRTVGEAIARAVQLHTDVPRGRRQAHVEDILSRVGLPRSHALRYPHQLSGGEKQRIGIARALATQPFFILCDEPTSALDVSVQATVLNVLADLREQEFLSYLFISHDLSVVAHISDRIAVMYAGRIIEIGATADVLQPPYHPYTEALLSAIPLPDPDRHQGERITLRTDVATSGQQIAGCPFHPRCPRKVGTVCETTAPPIRQAAGGLAIACHIPLDELSRLPSVLPTPEPAPPSAGKEAIRR